MGIGGPGFSTQAAPYQRELLKADGYLSVGVSLRSEQYYSDGVDKLPSLHSSRDVASRESQVTLAPYVLVRFLGYFLA